MGERRPRNHCLHLLPLRTTARKRCLDDMERAEGAGDAYAIHGDGTRNSGPGRIFPEPAIELVHRSDYVFLTRYHS
ncbi:unnamed protein product [Gongylonema pulchrum]|uniref:HNH endonuclease n=1 Tax=Gongylonema pulchrum TaxID=637853 RepID=A0A183EII0_9BILA|nr:unnamed protein product [Gongylonema pulchrum]